MTNHRNPCSRLSFPCAAIVTVLALSISTVLHAQDAPAPTSSEWGGIGLLQTPTARMAEDGDMAFTASYNSPYSRYNFTMQPFSWLEGTFRYINVSNLAYGPESLSGDQHYKDKSIDVKVRLWNESRWLPEVALGVRDLGGTGLFSSEYLVASKRWGSVDASLGLATGYIGNRGDFSNPLGIIDDRFKTRPVNNPTIGDAGQFGIESMFRGRVGVFGGLTYQTPLDSLSVKVEYDGNDYKNEPRRNNLAQSTPINVGLVYRPNKNVELTAAWERGEAAMVSLTLRGNPGNARTAPKPLDPEPVAWNSAMAASESTASGQDQASKDSAVDWAALAGALRSNAGFRVREIRQRGDDLVVTGYQQTYFKSTDGLDRASRLLNATLGESYGWYTLRTERLGLPIVETSVKHDAFRRQAEGEIRDDELRRSIELVPASDDSGTAIYTPKTPPFGGGFSVGYRQNLGGPDGFVLFQIAANYSASYFLRPDLWLTGTVSQDLFNNYDKFSYDAPSRLPRVRTDLRRYMRESSFTMPNLQVNASHKFGRDIFGIAYAGYLEWMYAGVGGEVLYRPINQPWAVGANVNWVRQRDFDQGFGLRDYTITTGHATLYYSFDRQERIVGSVSAGRYLAGDYGATVNIARVFPNGLTMGAYATKTNISSAEFGEGSFDKGIYFSIPLDNILPRSTRGRANVNWNPLIRDGGAMLSRKYSLYNVTGERDRTGFYQELP